MIEEWTNIMPILVKPFDHHSFAAFGIAVNGAGTSLSKEIGDTEKFALCERWSKSTHNCFPRDTVLVVESRKPFRWSD